MSTVERPILFSAPMVCAILSGTKTQTRRLVKPQPELQTISYANGFEKVWTWRGTALVGERERFLARCPYGRPGDRLWVRETWAPHFIWEGQPPAAIPNDGKSCIFYSADNAVVGACSESQRAKTWRPSIHMPRWASRILLDVVDVRVEQLNAITEDDAKSEGVPSFFDRFNCIGRDQRLDGEMCADAPYRASFKVLWDEINGDRALWVSNPWVWVVSFKRAEVPRA